MAKTISLVCDKCSYRIPRGANFCPNCGDPVTEADIVKVPVAPSRPTIDIQFRLSKSPSYDVAVEYASSFPSYFKTGEGNKTVHSVSFQIEDVQSAVILWEMVSGWKTSAMIIDRKRATKKDLTYGVIGCFQKFQELDCNKDHCCYDNMFGCKQIGIGNYSFMPDSPGRLVLTDKMNGLHIDFKSLKQRIEAALAQVIICPAFDLLKVKKVYRSLPRSFFSYYSEFPCELEPIAHMVKFWEEINSPYPLAAKHPFED